jgi:hypothetical protein
MRKTCLSPMRTGPLRLKRRTGTALSQTSVCIDIPELMSRKILAVPPSTGNEWSKGLGLLLGSLSPGSRRLIWQPVEKY